MEELFVQESWNEIQENDTRISLGTSEVYETFTSKRGELFRSLQKEHGRCTSKIYIGDDQSAIGWVFVKRQEYEDCNQTYLQETWVTVHTKEPTKSIEYHYAFSKFSKKVSII